MQITLRAFSIALVLAGIISAPALAATESNQSTDFLMRGAKKWASKDRPDLAKNLLKKLILIEPTSEEALFMLGNIELKNGKPDEALRYLHTLQQAAPNSPRTHELSTSYRLLTSDKDLLENMRTLAQAGKMAQAEKILKQIYPDKPPSGELGMEYYRIVGSTASGYAKVQDELSALYKETGDTRYRLVQLELQSNRPEHVISAVNGYEELSRRPGVNAKQLQENWRRSLYKYPDHADKQGAIKNFLSLYPRDKEMIELLTDVQKNIAARSQFSQPATPSISPTKLAKKTVTRESKAPKKIVVKQPPEEIPQETIVEAETPALDPDIIARTDALDALADGDTELAETSLLDIIKRRPHDPEVIGGLGLVKQKQGKFTEAEQWFSQALQEAQLAKVETARWESLIETARFSQYMTNAKALLDENKLADAESAVGQALAMKPNDPDAQAVLGNIRYAENNLVEAERLYREALQTEGYNIFAARGLATLLARTGRSEEAIEFIHKVLQDYQSEWRKSPYGQASLLRTEAGLHIDAHRPSRAMKVLETAVEIDPKNPWVRFSLAKLYISLNLPPLARHIVQEGVELAPQDPSMHQVRALVLLSLDDYAAGIESLNQIPEESLTQDIRDTKSLALVKYSLQQADIKLAQGNRKEALRILAIAETQAENSAVATEQVAEGWFRIGQQNQGLSAMRKLPQPVSLKTQVHYAALLNRAKKDQELTDYLPSLRIPDGADEISKGYRETIQDIEFAMASRQYDKLMKGGKKEQAQQFAETILNASTLSNSDYFKYHRRYFYSARLPEGAISMLNEEKEQYPDDLNIRYELAYAYYDEKQNSNAQRELNELIALTKADDAEMRLRIAKLQQSLGDSSAARETFDDLINRFPDNTAISLQAGYIAQSEGRYNQAMDYFQLTRDRSPSATTPATTTAALSSAPEQSNGILLNLLPESSFKTKPAAPPTLASTSQSERIYRTALASDVPQKRVMVSSSDAANAEEAMNAIKSRRKVEVGIGLDMQAKNATDGLSTYHATEIPMIAHFPIGYEAYGTLHVDKVDINTGALAPADANLFGRGQPIGRAIPQQASGTNIGFAYEQGSVKADIGMVGIGFPISNVVGGLRKNFDIGRMSYTLKLDRRPYTGSLVSYAGAIDPTSGITWGGVTSNGATLYMNTTVSSELFGEYHFSGLGSYWLVRGKNVVNNDRLWLRAMFDKDLYATDDMILNMGLKITHTGFSKDEGYYTFGHGGYYSPASSLQFTLIPELIGRDGLLSYEIRPNLTYSRTTSNSALRFPTDPLLQQASGNAVYNGGTSNAISYGLIAATEYRATPNIAVGGRFNMDRSTYYNPNSLLFYLKYMFTPETGPVNMRPQPVYNYSQF